MSKVLITGATGFIGNEVAKEILKNYPKERITIIGRKIKSWNYDLIKKNIKIIDLYKDNIKKLGNFDYIIHCAALLDTKKQYSWKKYYNNNIFVLDNLINSLDFKKFIFISSGSIFSSQSDIPNPNNYYGLSKYICEKILEIFSLNKKKQIIILRLPIVVGQNSNNNIVDDFSKLIKMNQKVEVYGNGKVKRNIIHTDEVVKVISKLCFKKKYKNNYEVFNLGSSSSLNIIDIIYLLKKLFKSKSKIIIKKKLRRANYDSIINLNNLKNNIKFKSLTTRASIIKLIKHKYI